MSVLIGPWNRDDLMGVGDGWTVTPRSDGKWDVIFDSVPYPYTGTTPAKVWGIMGFPAGSRKRVPAVVVIHGGGLTADPTWVDLWTARGFACISVDVGGLGPDGLVLPGGSILDNQVPYKYNTTFTDVRELWAYHGVVHVVKAARLLGKMSQVDPRRIGVVGLSWGGDLAALTAGVDAATGDPAFAAAAAIYGAGFFTEQSRTCSTSDDPATDCAGMTSLGVTWYAAMTAQRSHDWLAAFDPASWLGYFKAPLYLTGGETDENYFPPGLTLTGRRSGGPVLRRIYEGASHSAGHGRGLAGPYQFMERFLAGGRCPAIVLAAADGDRVVAVADGDLASAELRYTLSDAGIGWTSKVWATQALTASGNSVTGAGLPVGTYAWYVTATASTGELISSEVVTEG